MRASLISVILPALAAAGPIIEARGPNEGIYLTNCLRFEPGINYSEMDYYTDAKHKSQNGERPDDLTYLGGYKGEYTPGKDFRVKWEGEQVCGTFSSTGEVFCSNIFANGATLVGFFLPISIAVVSIRI